VNIISGSLKKLLYFEGGKYISMPKKEREKVEGWFLRYLDDPETPFPLHGDTGSDEYTFTVDFEKDVEIVRNWNLKKDMAAYNKEHNALRNKEKGESDVLKRARSVLTKEEYTKDEVLALGYKSGSWQTLLDHNLLVRKPGGKNEDGKFVYVKNFV
jgi:hypothetical protein